MGGFFSSSIGKKLIMSISGLFLITFLAVHLVANVFLLVGQESYNAVSEFMGTNPVIQLMQPVLALGFIFHILYSVVLTIQNMKARGRDKYDKFDQSQSSTWTSRNMLPLGLFVGTFLTIHLIDFFVPIQFEGVHDHYTLVKTKFETWYFSVFYILGAIFLGLHLAHGFWSGFQTIGWSNDLWRNRLETIGKVYAVVIALGFSIIPLYFLVKQYV